MKLTKNHLFNILLWVIIILFMGVKSIEHTLKVHDDGVGVAIHEYSIQAQARMSHLINALSRKKVLVLSCYFVECIGSKFKEESKCMFH